MSRHEYEELVAYSIEALDQANDKSLDVRSLAWNLYAYQGMFFDTSFTHFRIMDVLLKHRYVYQFNITEHPDYTKYTEAYDQLIACFDDNEEDEDDEDFAIYAEPVDEDGNLVELDDCMGIDEDAGYYAHGLLHVDAGNELWTRLVANQRLSGRDAVAPEDMPMQNVVLHVVKAAQKLGYTDLIKWWYPGLTTALFDDYDSSIYNNNEALYLVLPTDFAALRNDPAILAIREIISQMNLLADTEIRWYNGLSMPSQDKLAEFIVSEDFSAAEVDFLQWWFFCDELSSS